jgi:hypothetical protein
MIAMVAPYPVRRFTVDEYHQMAAAGVLCGEDRVELLEGWITPKMMTHNPLHDGSIDLLDEALRQWLPTGWRIRTQSAISTVDSEPEPDLVVVRGSSRDFLERHPGPDLIGLVVEVADSSLDRDRNKRRLYARASIPIYWILNLVDRQLEVYRQPSGPVAEPAYREATVHNPGDTATVVIGGQPRGKVAVADLLP